MSRRTIKLQYNAPVTLSFFFASLAALLLGILTGGQSTRMFFCVYRSSLTDPLFYLRLFGHVLGHADWNHFINNMLLFLVVAPPLEEKYGSRTLLCGIAITAVISGILQCVFFPASALLGASGQRAAGGIRHCVYADHACQPCRQPRRRGAGHAAAGGCAVSGATGVCDPVCAGQCRQLYAHCGRRVRYGVRLCRAQKITA